MKNFEVLGRIDPAPLLDRLSKSENLWQASTRETFKGSPHAQAHSIIARWAKKPWGWTDEQAAFRCLQTEDRPPAAALMPQLGDAVMEVLELVWPYGPPAPAAPNDQVLVEQPDDLGRVMLTRLQAGAVITPHADEGLYAEYYDRFHVCLAGGRGNSFRCGGEIFYPEPGQVFWFNHKREHSVQNFALEGATGAERIHLIVDAFAPLFTAKRGLYFQAEPVGDLWSEAMPLLEAHRHEVAHYQDIALDPDIQPYQRLEAAGSIRCYTARDGGDLVGYALFFVRPNHHYRGSVQAWQDVIYLAPQYRRGRAGITLIRVAETRLRAEGVQVVYHHAKRTNKVGELLERLGYELVDEIYAKRLDR